MCCFGARVFALIAITCLSFILHKFYPQIPVIAYYLLLANLLAFVMFALFFKDLLPKFVKPSAIHYFSLIGGVLAGLAATLVFKKFDGNFLKIELVLLAFWILIVSYITLNFTQVSAFFAGFLS
ncbi:hypothetical protein [Campylobacter sp. RM16188]|uniref:hypothetical protein n=1 Tax=Campylobacter sp. RM16188 TaxID=1705725 RepID=UPI0015548184|nr:hypothetical protein [Campylobacter sp. RM16188]